jgi:hypothetical protein
MVRKEERSKKKGVAPCQVIDNKYVIRKYMYILPLKRDLYPPKKLLKRRRKNNIGH